MRWRVEVSDISGDQRLIRDVLKELSLDVIEVDGRTCLLGKVLEGMDFPSQVFDHVSRIRDIGERVCGYEPSINLGFSLGPVVEIAPDGQHRKHHFLEVHECLQVQDATNVTLEVQTGPSTLSEGELRQIESARVEQEYQQVRSMAVWRVIAALSDERALQVQRLLSTDLTPQVLGHVAELMQADLGGRIVELASGNEWTRFYRSINHPDVFGEAARHIVSSMEPPLIPWGSRRRASSSGGWQRNGLR